MPLIEADVNHVCPIASRLLMKLFSPLHGMPPFEGDEPPAAWNHTITAKWGSQKALACVRHVTNRHAGVSDIRVQICGLNYLCQVRDDGIAVLCRSADQPRRYACYDTENILIRMYSKSLNNRETYISRVVLSALSDKRDPTFLGVSYTTAPAEGPSKVLWKDTIFSTQHGTLRDEARVLKYKDVFMLEPDLISFFVF